MPTPRQLLAEAMTTPAAAVADCAELLDQVAERAPGSDLMLIALHAHPTWTGTFVELLASAATSVGATDEDVRAVQRALRAALEQRSEDRLFAGAAARRADWPICVAALEAHDALDDIRHERSPCRACGTLDGPWASTTFLGVTPREFVERTCRACYSRSTAS